jgi:hypothetical protein
MVSIERLIAPRVITHCLGYGLPSFFQIRLPAVT